MIVMFADGNGTIHVNRWDAGISWIKIEDEIYLTWGKDVLILDVNSVSYAS